MVEATHAKYSNHHKMIRPIALFYIQLSNCTEFLEFLAVLPQAVAIKREPMLAGDSAIGLCRGNFLQQLSLLKFFKVPGLTFGVNQPRRRVPCVVFV